MKSSALTVQDYLAGLPADRRAAISAVRDIVNKHLPKGFREGIGYGMIVWCVPLESYPDTYNGQPLMYAALASQKQYMAVYLMTLYGAAGAAAEFHAASEKAGKKLDKGKSCVRFKQLGDLHLPAVARAIGCCSMADYVRHAEAARDPEQRAVNRKAAGLKPIRKPAKRPGAKPVKTAAGRASAPARRQAATAPRKPARG